MAILNALATAALSGVTEIAAPDAMFAICSVAAP